MSQSEFFQAGPELRGNQFLLDGELREILNSLVDEDTLKKMTPQLEHLGQRVTRDILTLSQEAVETPPRLLKYEPWGERVDKIVTSPAWPGLHRVAAEEGIVSVAYEKPMGPDSRLFQAALLYLFHPSSAFYSCPLAMTDGAAKCLEAFSDKDFCQKALARLTSRHPDEFWTSGQWMTERPGGSDVGRTETMARAEGDGFRLFGTKWFTSATTSDMALTLARTEGAASGSRGLSLFFVDISDKRKLATQAEVLRLKDKLGTKALPTAEMRLQGLEARLLGEEGRGVKEISQVLNITRYYNSVCSVAAVRRLMVLAMDYAKKRWVFSSPLESWRLHQETLAEVKLELVGGMALVFHTAQLLGKEESGAASAIESGVLRILIPSMKLFTGKQATQCTSELLEVFGGAGYIEDTGLPLFLRDAQVFSLWEGTTNVLSLDVLRAIEKEKAFEAFSEWVVKKWEKISGFNPEKQVCLSALEDIAVFLKSADKEEVMAGARELSFGLARLSVATLLCEMGSGSDLLVISARRWCQRRLVHLSVKGEEHFSETQKFLGMSEHGSQK